MGDNVNDLLAAYGDKYEVCIFCADGEPREPYRLTTYMNGHQRVYRTTVEFQEKMDWFPRNESIEPIFEQFLELEKTRFGAFSLHPALDRNSRRRYKAPGNTLYHYCSRCMVDF